MKIVPQKKCRTCLEYKDVTFFTKDKTTSDGYYGECKSCKQTRYRVLYKNSNYRKKRALLDKERAKRTKDILISLKQEGCMACDEQGEPCCLDFHHINKNEKELTISGYWNAPLVKTLIELKKCIVLCANCHRKVHSDVLNIDNLINSKQHLLFLEKIEDTIQTTKTNDSIQ